MSKYSQLLKEAAINGKVELPAELVAGKVAYETKPYSTMTDEECFAADQYEDFVSDFASHVGTVNNFETCWCLSTIDFTAPYEGSPTHVEYSSGWGEGQLIELPTNPTILDVWRACDAAIRKSGDLHHTFIENLHNTNGVLDLTTGS